MHDVGMTEHLSKRLGLKASEYVWIYMGYQNRNNNPASIYI